MGSVGRQVGGHDPPDGAVSAIDDEDGPDDAKEHGQEDRRRQIVLTNDEAHEPAVEKAGSESEHHEGTQETKECQGSSPNIIFALYEMSQGSV